jgi:hypothetical protein
VTILGSADSAMNNQVGPVGLIAEDYSDVETAQVLIRRIVARRISFKHFVGQGCGKIKHKCYGWACDLKKRGCNYLIILHDLDRRNLCDLKKELEKAIAGCPIAERLLCIPIEELEAWLLSDPKAIAAAIGLKKYPRIRNNVESISSPKEFLQRLVKKESRDQKIYLHTKHNAQVAAHLDLARARMCSSFVPFFEFVSERIV